MTRRFVAREARRAGLVVLADAGPATERLSELCESFADQGYEVAALRLRPGCISDVEDAVAGLAPPVCVLGIGEAAAAGWTLACRPSDVAAVSLYDPDLSSLPGEPQRPMIVHLSLQGSADAEQIEALRLRHEIIPVHAYGVAPGFVWRRGDAARLARLRTLQLFHKSVTTRGEIGG